MQLLLQNLRYGFRSLLRNPGVCAAVLALALVIGRNTAIFARAPGTLVT
jgi:hypothetical protein